MREILLPDPERAKKALSEYGENAVGWEYAEQKKLLDNMALIIKKELIHPLALLHRIDIPDVIVGFDDAGNRNILAYYNTVPNAHGMPDEVIMNTAHYEEKDGKMVWKYGLWSQLETLTHEMAHGLLTFVSRLENRKIPAHGDEFVKTCAKIGLKVVPNVGSHYQVADSDSPFGRLMKSMGISRPDDVPRAEGEKTDWFRPSKEKGKSTLTKWECGCGQKARVGTKEFDATCNRCGTVFIRMDAVNQTIYKAK